MKWTFVGLCALSLPAPANEADPKVTPELIDATRLSVTELMALAAAERDGAEAHSCCDWGGLGCRAETMSAARSRTPES